MDAFSGSVDTSRFAAVRNHTEYLASALSAEDQCIQSMPDASPVKWHRAHTTWFFEQFVLVPHLPEYRIFDADFQFLFNSYYETIGDRQPRPQRGLITRPSCDHVTAYRAHVDAAMGRLIGQQRNNLAHLIELGLQHEQQHQELLLTDITHAFAQNKLLPAAVPHFARPAPMRGEARFVAFDGGLVEIGHPGAGFHFDNETPRHRVHLEPYRLANRLVRNRDWLDFMTDGGYRTATLWMSDGWAEAQEQRWCAPLHWRKRDGVWFEFGPEGLRRLDPEAPVAHISWYEADAFARWAWARLPTEAEWEAASGDARLSEMTDTVWQWTASAYAPYPGFRPVPGAIGEYNGKFMINQMVLRGSSVATPPGHARPSYRNFYHPDKRWQFSGLRLAQDC
ncbi:ergothioneine biosynthesis protein EgtB [Acidiphilium sp. AL]|uniref:Ergothioneine biosynthesis protein EgtB n=1 Tax=Acidiphilium iwatense TaxID=768198 RepID=A0ABS9DXP7_9PROT|nr:MULTISPECIES: ergothioneine biosynthesis protein EgtB [Acidiphilium]MCF3947524.1 ergothioneine biosynthesis protein EgtB [Acidiphilium iwatense]MCU4158577.1 ergothioneine biosynthesis protein EgtB [Acidiphilium sp. AL]